MKQLKWVALVAAVLILQVAPVKAVEPNEILKDPALEARARSISKGLRCLVCRNENIDDSNAKLARDLRKEVRRLLLEGKSDKGVVASIVDDYGEYVLLNPVASGSNRVLWLTGPVMALIAGAGGLLYLRRRSTAPAEAEAALSDDERARLNEIMDE